MTVRISKTEIFGTLGELLSHCPLACHFETDVETGAKGTILTPGSCKPKG